MSEQLEPQSMAVTVPDGILPGQLIQFKAPDGTMMQVAVPEGKQPGEEFEVRLGRPPDESAQMMMLKVPEGCIPGQEVQFSTPDGAKMQVAIPEGKMPGDTFKVMLGQSEPPANTQRLTVPEGCKGGEEMQFDGPDGSRMRTTVPEGLVAGEEFTVNLRTRSSALMGRLCAAVSAGDIDTAKLCVAQGTSVNSSYEYGFTPLFYAAVDGQLEAAKWLLEQKANVAARNYELRTPLHWAARNGHIDVVRLLMAAGAPLEAEDKNGKTPMALAVSKSQNEAAGIIAGDKP
mmetsp:Transcript_56811/g.122834  ORF Transcript_56811/g.122834 Transcript_56811/m.122834 type:complete len:288 (+) Transcript_56811:72-935(+)